MAVSKKAKKPVRGRDLAQPARSVTLDGVTYPLVWCNKQARITEQVYETQYGIDADYLTIVQELSRLKFRALEACVYGALRAGGAEMTFETFDGLFSFASIDQVREMVQQSVADSLPDPEQLGN